MPGNTAVLSAREHSQKLSAKTRKIAMTIVALAFIMDLLDSTIVNIAIPSIQANLGASYTAIQWLVAGYALAFSLLLITGGRMGDVFGYRKIFMIGVTGFTVASLLSGVAWSPLILICARLLQGAMAALMVPQVMSMMQVMYPPEERGQINGLFGGMAGVAASLGPVIGGLLIKANLFGLDWRPIFLINIPVGLFALWAAPRYLPIGKSAHPLKLDLVGTGIIMLALALVVFPLIQGRELGWPAWTFYSMIASLPFFALFALWQIHKQRTDGSPLVLPALFKKPSFSLGLITNVVFESVMIGYFLISTLMLQIGLGFSVVKAALTGIPLSIGIAATFGILGAKVIPKLGRYSMTLGTVIMSAGLIYLTWAFQHFGTNTSPWEIIPGLLPVGVGMGLIMMPVFAVVLNDVDHNHAGSASGVLNAIQQLGGAIGVAAIGVIFFGQLTAYIPQSLNTATTELIQTMNVQHIPSVAQKQVITGFKTCYTDRINETNTSVTPNSCKASSHGPTSPQLKQALEDGFKTAVNTNFTHAFKTGIEYALVLLAVVFGLSFLLPRHIRQEAYQES